MSTQKINKVTIRFDQKEKIFLEKKAKAENMSLSEYLRYIALHGQEKDHEDDHGELNLISKNIIETRCYSKAIAIKLLDEEEFRQVGDLIKLKKEGKW